MVIAFANNQVMVANTSTTTTIFTDPVPLNDNDRATCHLLAEYIFNTGGVTGLAYQGQVSNDGVNWVDAAGVADSTNVATPIVRTVPGVVINGAFLRFKFTLTANAVGIAACNFDLHVLIDHV